MRSPSAAGDRIVARTDHQARSRFLQVLNLTLHVVSPHAFWQTTRAPGDGMWKASTVPDEAVPMRLRSGGRLHLWSTITYRYGDHSRFPGDRKVHTTSYAHTITDDRERLVERFSWQWHPVHWPYPHVHLDHGSEHVPTGRVFLEHVVLFLVHDLGVAPTYDDWRHRLDANLSRVSRYSTWGGTALS